MKYFLQLILFALFFNWVSCYGLPNLNPVGNANSNGFVRLTKIEFPMDENDSLRMFYLEFNTSPLMEPSDFGVFWHMPVFSSKIELSKSNELKWYAPNGRTYSFCAHSTVKKGKQIESFVDNTSTWRAIKKKTGFEIVSLKDGSVFTYTDGRLTEFMLKGDKRKYQIFYRRDGTVMSVKERNGTLVMAFEYHKDQKHIKSIKNFEGLYSFEYHERKTGDILGSDGIYGKSLLLRQIKYPDETTLETIEYSKQLSRSRIMLLKDLNETATSPLNVLRMSMVINEEAKGWVEWCATTGLIMADNGGEYMIGNDRYDSFFPNFKPGQPNGKFSAIKYKSLNMPYPKIHMFDYQNFYEIKGDPLTGEIIRNAKIGACGPLKMKTRKIERLSGTFQNPEWTLVKSYVYDNHGKWIRILDERGNEYVPREILTVYKPLAEREIQVTKMLLEFENEKLSDYKKADILLNVAAMYHYRPDWKPELKTAISTYERILKLFPNEPVMIARSYCMLASAYMEMGGSDNYNVGLGYLKELYALDLTKMNDSKKDEIVAMQDGVYKVYLAFQESGEPLRDIEFAKHMAATDARTEKQKEVALERIIYHQKRIKK